MSKLNPQPYYLQTEFLARYAYGDYDEDHRLKALAAEILRLHEIIDGLIEGARELVNTADLIAHRPDTTTTGGQHGNL